MKFYVGTSGFSYKEWKGTFYPRKIPASEMLEFYSQHFISVENNNSFYSMPTSEVLKSWAAEVPAKFKIAMKAPQRITHFLRLKNTRPVVLEFLDTSFVLKKKLGPFLFQLPPNFKKDIDRLRDFLSLVPSRLPTAFEFRHASWFDPETFQLLKKHRVALCIAEEKEELKVPFQATAKWGYLRLRKDDYTDSELKKWIREIKKQSWKDVYVFFKHDSKGNAPKLATRFIELSANAH